jgi:hypothetical protein
MDTAISIMRFCRAANSRVAPWRRKNAALPLCLSHFTIIYRRIHQHAFRMPEGSITLLNLCLEFMM